MVAAYLVLAVWFWLVDMLAGEVGGIRPRPLAAAVLALLWPLSVPFALCASALIIRRLRVTARGGESNNG